MAITTYAELLAAIQNWAWRDDDDFANRCREFVALAEAELSKKLRLNDMRRTDTLYSLDGTYEMPSGVQAIVSLRPASNPYLTLEPATADYVDTVSDGRAGGVPAYYTMSADGLTVSPSSMGDLLITYYQAIPPLSDANPTNWLLQRSPSTYLYASLIQAATFMQDDQRLATFSTLLDDALGNLMALDVATNHAGQSMRLRGPTP